VKQVKENEVDRDDESGATTRMVGWQNTGNQLLTAHVTYR
jgi:hypothetical protein